MATLRRRALPKQEQPRKYQSRELKIQSKNRIKAILCLLLEKVEIRNSEYAHTNLFSVFILENCWYSKHYTGVILEV